MYQFDCINLGYYVRNISDYIVRDILNQIVCQDCINLLIKNNFNHAYNNSELTISVSRGKLINMSNGVSLFH